MWKIYELVLIVPESYELKTNRILSSINIYTCDNHVVVNKYFSVSLLFFLLTCSGPTATKHLVSTPLLSLSIDTDNDDDTIICLWSWNISLLFGCCLRKNDAREMCFYSIFFREQRKIRRNYQTTLLSQFSSSPASFSSEMFRQTPSARDVDKSRQ